MTLNCQGKLVDLSVPKIMGILNLTPDSFYDGGQFNSIDLAVKQTEKMLQEGATFIDIGAASSRPGCELRSRRVWLRRRGSHRLPPRHQAPRGATLFGVPHRLRNLFFVHEVVRAVPRVGEIAPHRGKLLDVL